MKKLPPSATPLIIALLFGLLVSLLPISPVLSDNVTACQGSGTTTSKLKLGGRNITPTLILQAAATGQSCPTGETTLSLVSLSRTIIVSPVTTATTNGTALLTAMTLISNSNPSATKPYLLKLEPGNYDLGSQALTLLPYVDLEGSGEDTTLISSTVGASNISTGTLVMAAYTQARFLSVANAGSHSNQLAVYAPGSATNTSLVHLTASASGGTSANMGFYSVSSGPVMVENSTFTASGGTSISAGFYNDGTASVEDSNFTAIGGSGSLTAGISNGTSVITVQNSTLTASGGFLAGGFMTGGAGGTNTIYNSVLKASGGSASTAAFLVAASGTTNTVQNSTLVATGTGSHGYYNAAGGTKNTIQNSTLTSDSHGYYNDGASVTTSVQNSTLVATGTGSYGFNNAGNGAHKVATSELSGVSGTANGTVTCVGSYNSSFVALGTNCQ